MKGNNNLCICEAEMIRAMQYYFDNVVFKERVRVVSVKYGEDSGSHGYIISLEHVKEEQDAGTD